MSYVCECGMILSNKYSLTRHQNSKSCRRKTNSKTNKKISYKCKNYGCKKYFTRLDHLNRHMKSCKYNVKKKISKNNHTNKLNGDNNANNNLLNDCTDVNINYDNRTTIINKECDTKIVLCVFGNDGDNITINKFMDAVESRTGVIEKLIELVNFDPDSPEHHNVYCHDRKSGAGFIYSKDGWVSKRMNEILDKLVDSKKSDIAKIFNKMSNALSDTAKKRLLDAIDLANEAPIGHDGRRNPYPIGSRKEVKKYIKEILYNNRDMVIATRNKTDLKSRTRLSRSQPIVTNRSIDLTNESQFENDKFDDLTIDDLILGDDENMIEIDRDTKIIYEI